MDNILVVGSINMDLVVSCDEIPKVGETVLGNNLSQYPGGKGANQAVAIARLGGNIKFLGKVGDDAYGLELLETMKNSGVYTSYIEKSKEKSGVAIINVNKKGENNIVVIPGANFRVDKQYLDKYKFAFQEADVVVFQFEIDLNTVKHGLSMAKSLNKVTIVNPAPAQDLDDETIKNIDILIPNEHELSRITKMPTTDEQSIIKAAHKLINKGISKVIVTLGSKGVLYIDKDSNKLYEPYSVKVVDTTGAGDSFIGGFTTNYAKDGNVEKSIMIGQAAAALTIQKQGAQTPLLTIKELEELKF